MIVGLTMWIQSTSVTDRRTDVQNYDDYDRATHIASRGIYEKDEKSSCQALRMQLQNKSHAEHLQSQNRSSSFIYVWLVIRPLLIIKKVVRKVVLAYV